MPSSSAAVPPGEDVPEQALRQVVHRVVHVGQRECRRRVGVGERVERDSRLRAGLLAHPLDDPPELRVQAVRVQAARGLRDVHHQVGRPLELVHDAQHGDDRPQVGRHRLLASEELVAAVLDRMGEVVDVVVVLDDLLGGGEVGVEERLRAGADRLGRQRRRAGSRRSAARRGRPGSSCGPRWRCQSRRHHSIPRMCLTVDATFGSFRQCSRSGHSDAMIRQDRR